MSAKTLNEKIKLVGFWTFGFIFWYLVISFFLKSKYPIYDYSFNLSITYDVLKDVLALAAAFLAPVAAFVLFSDWRKQHIEIKREACGERVMLLMDEVVLGIDDLSGNICIDIEENAVGKVDEDLKQKHDQLIFNKKTTLFTKIGIIDRELAYLVFGDNRANEFKALAEKIVIDMKDNIKIQFDLNRTYKNRSSPDHTLWQIKLEEIKKDLFSLVKEQVKLKV